MQVKGTALRTTRDFVKTKFPEQYSKWIDSLPAESKALYTTTIDATVWYSFQEGYTIPIAKIAELCFNSDFKTAGEQIGNYSAEIALKGFYKVFLLVASPNYLLQRASKIFTTFYDPSRIEAEITGPNAAVLRIIEFEGIDEAVEYRIAGWIRKALELANCREPSYRIGKALSKGEAVTEIFFQWN